MFITLEGGEGSGKSYIAKKLVDYLNSIDINAAYTREPGGVKISEAIRDIILDNSNTNLDYKAEALLYAASRAQHLREKVKPLLDQGYVVICDRFIDSSLAYQGYARELGVEDVYNINKYAINGMMPDITFFLDVTPEIGLSRVDDRNDAKNRFDNESLMFHHKVYDGYKSLIGSKYDNNRIISIDATGSKAVVFDDVRTKLMRRLGR